MLCIRIWSNIALAHIFKQVLNVIREDSSIYKGGKNIVVKVHVLVILRAHLFNKRSDWWTICPVNPKHALEALTVYKKIFRRGTAES